MSYKVHFPILSDETLVYLDNAATSQKPAEVIEAIAAYYKGQNGSPHRGAHRLSVASTALYEAGRRAVQDFIGADRSDEIIFTRNATEALNMITYSFVEYQISSHQNIVLAITNHHSNILPFQRLAKRKGFELRYLYCDDQGYISKEELKKIDANTFMVSIPYISNGLGIKHDVKGIFEVADLNGAYKLLDAAQAVGHEVVDVKALDADLMVFSGHKMFAPQGIGVLYGRYKLLDTFEPFLSGGDMIEYVEEQSSTYAPLPERLEAGTQNVAGVLGLTKAIHFIDKIGLESIVAYEKRLTQKAMERLQAVEGIEVYGPKSLEDRGALITFNIKDVHPHDVASILDSFGIAIRAGHHCCQPLMKYLNTASTCRASFSLINEPKDIDRLIEGIKAVKEVFYE